MKLLKQIGCKLELTTISPSCEIDKKVSWIYVIQNDDNPIKFDKSKVGKWMLFIREEQVDEIWDKICRGVKTKNIWKAKVKPKSNLTKKEYPIIVYTYDYEDKDDVKRVLHYLLRNNLTLGKTIYYKLDKQTRIKRIK